MCHWVLAGSGRTQPLVAAFNTQGKPVDKILEQRRNSLATPALRDSAPPTVVKPAATAAPRDPADLRTRGAR